jgi:sigma-B regulation protein RsbU (phosphoserine phosphatase)
MLRTRIMQSGSLGEVVSDVNRLLCLDTDRTGDFMTLYVMMIDKTTWKLRWVRAGHAPAILYDWQNDSFEELRGEGSALGVLDSSAYEEYHYNSWNGSKLLFLGTDGIWETENPQGEMYGMERLRTLLREHCQFSAQAIIDTVMSDLTCFRDSSPQEDDITMVVLKSEQSTGSSENRT